MTSEYTTLKVSKKLTEKLKEFGRKSETYEDMRIRMNILILRLCNNCVGNSKP